jgi:S-adenosylmethionine:tRNA ribosyltransferase-isomerase
MVKRSEFRFTLPPERIAQEPVSPRDRSRLLVLSRNSGRIEHRRFFELADILQPGDIIVVNATRVFPARLKGRKKSGGKVELLLLEETASPRRLLQWHALVRGTNRPSDLEFPEGLTATLEKRLENGEWLVQFGSNSLRSYLDRHGAVPLPPYIKRAVKNPADRAAYQTVYAKSEGAVAAPTAGFHFTPEGMEHLRSKGISFVEIVLHVGWGTFRPLRAETVEEHRMLPERYEVSAESAQKLTEARREKRRIVAVGTTTVRTLESVVRPDGRFQAGTGETDLFIFPGYRFRAVDALITNFHLPDSTPLLLACAFYAQGSERPPFSLKPVYDEAIREGYRFYSYGDAMLIQ